MMQFFQQLIGESQPSPVVTNWLFVIAGQSNGVGWLTGTPAETYLNDPIPNTYIYTGSAWEQLEYGVNNEGNSGHAIELNLGWLARQQINGNVYIVKLAEGSTALGDESGTTTDWSTTGTLFPALVTKFNNAVAALQSQGVSYIFKGFWWNQGERDANDATLYADYATNLAALETRIRSQFSGGSNLLNFVTVRLSSQITRTYLSEIRSAQETKTYVNVDDLTLQADNIHHTSASQNIIAQRFLNKCI